MNTNSQKLLGIDHGEKKVGLALADTETKIATPYKILTNDKNLLEAIKDICLKEEIGKIVVGVPLTLKSASSVQTKKVLKFIEKLKKATYIDIAEQDERMSSAYARTLLKEMKVKHLDDDVAAMLILQSYLDEKLG
ncbi:MAG: Holliday junction resolvase RuvX [Candidatus Parcubacteria bacterium]|nr:Holliday junction resolvase RuvX [Candidatus Parcubacteria bacterium]